jgi:hypothetical protein
MDESCLGLGVGLTYHRKNIYCYETLERNVGGDWMSVIRSGSCPVTVLVLTMLNFSGSVTVGLLSWSCQPSGGLRPEREGEDVE